MFLDWFLSIYVGLAGAVEMANKSPIHPKIKNKLILYIVLVLYWSSFKKGNIKVSFQKSWSVILDNSYTCACISVSADKPFILFIYGLK